MKTKRVSRTGIPKRAKNAFWQVVEDCLVEIHGLPRQDAQDRCADLRTKIEQPPPGISSDIFYHEEPFYVACDLAGNRLDPSHYQSQYQPILNLHNW